MTPAAATLLSRDVGVALRAMRIGKGLHAATVQEASGVSSLAYVEIGRASIADMDAVARVMGTTLPEVVQEVRSAAGATTPPHTLTHVAGAILSLSVRGSRVEAAINAAVREAMRVADGNQSAAARLLGMERKAFVRRLARARKEKL